MKHIAIKQSIAEAKGIHERFRQSVAGWVLNYPIADMLISLQYDQQKIEPQRNDFLDAFGRVFRISVALVELGAMFLALRKADGFSEEDE